MTITAEALEKAQNIIRDGLDAQFQARIHRRDVARPV